MWRLAANGGGCRRVLPLLLALAATSACEPPCTPSRISASEATVFTQAGEPQAADLTVTLSSARGRAVLSGKSIEFSIDGQVVGERQTDDRGRTTMDLMIEPDYPQRALQDRAFSASFDGDATYCPSSDGARVVVVERPSRRPPPGP